MRIVALPRRSRALVFATTLAACFNPSGADDPSAPTTTAPETSGPSTSLATTTTATTTTSGPVTTSTTAVDPTSTVTSEATSTTSLTDTTTDPPATCGDGIPQPDEFCFKSIHTVETASTDIAIGNFLGNTEQLEVLAIGTNLPGGTGLLLQIEAGMTMLSGAIDLGSETRIATVAPHGDQTHDVAAFGSADRAFTLWITAANSDKWDSQPKDLGPKKKATWLVAGSIDDDPHDDIVTDDTLDGKLYVWLNPGNPQPDTPPFPLVASATIAGGLGDLDSDGLSELVVLTNGGDMLAIHRGSGNSMFPFVEPPTTHPLPAMHALAVTNIDGEPNAEILLAGAEEHDGGRCALWADPPSGSAEFFFCGEAPVDFAVARQGGVAMMFVADQGNVIHVLRPSTDGITELLASVPTLSTPRAIAVGDLNGDDRLDFAVAGADKVEIFVASD